MAIQRKRSLDEKRDFIKFDGPTVVLKGHPTRGIPHGASVRVVSLPGGGFVKEVTAESKEIPLTLDPGKYTYVIRKHYPGTNRGFRYVADFLVGMTEEQWETMQGMRPTLAKCRQTTQGPRWTCGYLSCNHTSMSVVAALEHEAGHQGLSFLQAIDAKAVEQQVVEAGAAHKIAKKAAKGVPDLPESGAWTNVPGVPSGR